MSFFRRSLLMSVVIAGLTASGSAAGVAVGQIDTFEDGTTQNWTTGLGPVGAFSPAPPINVPDGGPLGAGDNFLRLVSIGGVPDASPNPGSRLSAINPAQWAGNYAQAQVTGIAMDLINFGPSDLNIRLLLENPLAGPPTDIAVTDAVRLPVGSGWMHVEQAIDPVSLTPLSGNVGTLLGNVTALRIVHSPDAVFPVPPVQAVIGVDNVSAIPEPAAATLLAFGLIALALFRRKRGSSPVPTSGSAAGY